MYTAKGGEDTETDWCSRNLPPPGHSVQSDLSLTRPPLEQSRSNLFFPACRPILACHPVLSNRLSHAHLNEVKPLSLIHSDGVKYIIHGLNMNE